MKTSAKKFARIAAIQFNYQYYFYDFETNTTQLKDNITNYYKYFVLSKEGEEKKEDLSFDKEFDMSLFEKLIFLDNNEISYIDKLIAKYLTKDVDLSLILKSIIRTAIFEIKIEKTVKNIDYPMIINEYIIIAKMFLKETEVKLVNAILDKIAKE